MKRRVNSSLSMLLVLLTFPALAAGNSTRVATSPPAPVRNEAPKQAAFQDAMRKLCEDHITWTRVFIISAAADLPDKDAATQRLLQNQVDIGNAIKPYYGA